MSPLEVKTGITLRIALFYILVAAVITLFIAYVLFQARFLIEGPQITLNSELGGPITERTITIEGTAKNIVRISLNGRQIYTDKYGNFKETLILENGYTIATLEATDRYGRTKRKTQEFVYTQPEEEHSDVLSINRE